MTPLLTNCAGFEKKLSTESIEETVRSCPLWVDPLLPEDEILEVLDAALAVYGVSDPEKAKTLSQFKKAVLKHDSDYLANC